MPSGKNPFNSLLSVLIVNLITKSLWAEGAILTEAKGLLSSPRATDWGEWGDWDNCPERNGAQTYVMGMRLKTEPAQGPGDDTALNGIRFMCGVLKERQKVLHSPDRQIESSVGGWGTWGVSYECPDGYAVGFQLRSEITQENHDDTAANNLRIFCSNTGTLSYLEGSGLSWGEWTDAQFCPYGWAMCGIKTQVEASKGHAVDDTALNNLDVRCCRVHTNF